MDAPELDELADAITRLAGARNRVPFAYLLRETALSVLILTRIASTKVKDLETRGTIDEACDYLFAILRKTARELPPDRQVQNGGH